MAELRIEVSGSEKLAAKIEALARVEDEMPGRLAEAIRIDAERTALDVRAAVLAEPLIGPPIRNHRGLRREIADGVFVDPTVPGGVRIGTSMPEADEAIIPRGFDNYSMSTGMRGWRHPLFGNRKKWYRETGAYSWFRQPIIDSQDRIERNLGKVMDEAADEVGRA